MGAVRSLFLALGLLSANGAVANTPHRLEDAVEMEISVLFHRFADIARRCGSCPGHWCEFTTGLHDGRFLTFDYNHFGSVPSDNQPFNVYLHTGRVYSGGGNFHTYKDASGVRHTFYIYPGNRVPRVERRSNSIELLRQLRLLGKYAPKNCDPNVC